MDFDTYYEIKFDKEQGQLLVAALNSYARRKNRDLRRRERYAEQAAINGETPTVAAISSEFPKRKQQIKMTLELRDAIKFVISEKKED